MPPFTHHVSKALSLAACNSLLLVILPALICRHPGRGISPSVLVLSSLQAMSDWISSTEYDGGVGCALLIAHSAPMLLPYSSCKG